jgi:hypothetical protein
MAASLVARRHGAIQPRLQFPTVRTAARMALRLAEIGTAIPAIVDDHNALVWEYPGGDPAADPGRRAMAQLRELAGLTA